MNGVSLGCVLNFGKTDGNGQWSLSDVFPAWAIGGWSEWLQFADGTMTNRIAFTVDDAPVGSAGCTDGTLYPAGPNAGYTMFKRYMSDWSPGKDSGEYTSTADQGGYGATL